MTDNNLSEQQLDVVTRRFEGEIISDAELEHLSPEFVEEFNAIFELDAVLRQAFQTAKIEDNMPKKAKTIDDDSPIRQFMNTMANTVDKILDSMAPSQPQYQWLGNDNKPIEWSDGAYRFTVGLRNAGNQYSLSGTVRAGSAEEFAIREVTLQHTEYGITPDATTFRLQKNQRGAYFSGFIPADWDHVELIFKGETEDEILYQKHIQIGAATEGLSGDG